MLCELNISNIALVDKVQLNFKQGLTVLTGETGAGKSVLVGAINLVLGERVNTFLIREGQDKGEVSAVFDISELKETRLKFPEVGVELEDTVILLQREILRTGKSRCFINGRQVPLNILKYIGEDLVDIHGQHEHQSLLKAGEQLNFLDLYAELEDTLGNFSRVFKEHKKLLKKRESLLAGSKDKASLIDFYKFQLKEIEELNLSSKSELEELEEEYAVLSKAESLKEVSAVSYNDLYEGDNSVINNLSSVLRNLESLGLAENEFNNILAQIKEINIAVQEVSHSLADYADKIEVGEDRVLELENRINIIHDLKRKYRKESLAELLDFYEDTKLKLAGLYNMEKDIDNIERDIKVCGQEITKLSRELSTKRKQAALRLAQQIKKEIICLGFNKVDFVVDFKEQENGVKGKDKVEFLFSPNQGEKLQALRDIASGGELSRVMLGIKVVLADKDKIPVIVFDEIDSNVGGRLGKILGEKLREVADKRQVICITHLPQIAGLAQQHWGVFKQLVSGRTVIGVNKLDSKARIEEVARMLGGKEYSQAALKHAEDLLLVGKV